MNSSNQLLEIYRQKLSLKTNQAVADRLGVKQPTVSMWLNEKSHPNAEAIATMCKATGETLAKWLPLIEAERCRTEADRKVWLRLAQMAAAVALMVGVTAPPSTAHAEDSNFVKSGHSVYYVNLLKALRRLGTRLAFMRFLFVRTEAFHAIPLEI